MQLFAAKCINLNNIMSYRWSLLFVVIDLPLKQLKRDTLKEFIGLSVFFIMYFVLL